MAKIINALKKQKSLNFLSVCCIVFIIAIFGTTVLSSITANYKSEGVDKEAQNTIYTSGHKLNGKTLLSEADTPMHHTVLTNLTKNAEYFFAVARNSEADKVLEDSNLCYADQGTSDENGELRFDYIPDRYENAAICLYGDEAHNVSETTWILSDSGKLSVSGNGSIGTVKSTGKSPWYESRNSIVSAEIQDSVSEISARAFADCSSIEEITIPKSVRSIDDNAFDGSGSVVIKGYKNTEAQEFALRNNFEFVELDESPEKRIGDINYDGAIDILDAVLVQKYSVDKVEFTDEQRYVADVNGDNIIDILDAVLIQKYAVEKITEFPKKG